MSKFKSFEFFQHGWKMIYNKWEIQVLVLISLGLQCILIVLGNRRKFSTSDKLIFFLWLTYLMAGWFATVSLSIISSNVPNMGGNNEKADAAVLEITTFWAPFFLLHLAGPDTITAYSLEDNSLWRREALTLVGQVVVALLVIIRAWAYTALNILTVLMFIPGMIKIGERIWVLRYGSTENFKSTTLHHADPGPNYARYMEEYNSRKDEGFDVKSGEVVEAPFVPDISFPAPLNNLTPEARNLLCAEVLFKIFRQLFSDLILSIQDIKNSQSFFQDASHHDAFNVIEIELGFMYDVFYTKVFKVYSWKGGLLRLFSFSLTVIVLFLFLIIIERDNYSKENIIISYVLLGGAIIIEIYSVLVLLRSDWSMLWLISKHKNAMVDLLYKAISSIPLLLAGNKRWSNTLGQYNLITYSLKKKPAKCGAIQRFLFHYELLERQRYQKSEKVSDHLKKLIFEQLKEKSESASDLNACTKLCACRGEWVLNNARCPDCIRQKKLTAHEVDSAEVQNAKCLNGINQKYLDIIRSSVSVEFDKSILLWHIATNLCYYSDTKTIPYDPVNSPNLEASKLLSNYMLYLLVMRPAMLPNGINQIRFQDTSAEAHEFFNERKSISRENQACTKLLEVSTEIDPFLVKGDRSKSVLFDGCRLAKSLKCLEPQKKWELISHVWVEMLCYAASKCPWNHHAQQLSRGGELFTHVWLLMAHLGITEQFQISKGHARTTLIVY